MEEIKDKIAELEILISEYRDIMVDNSNLSEAHRYISKARIFIENL